MTNAVLTNYDLTQPKGLADAVAYLLDLKKGKDVVTIDLGGKTIVADYFVIASAYSSTAVKALSDFVEDELSKHGLEPIHRDADAKWVALDYGSVIVHVFYKELREFYQIERLWADGDNIKKFVD
ncbi:MAG: ribosome silencing factor [Christensenellales bacterium]|jgi:iojap-like protein